MFTLSSKGVYGTAALLELAEHYRSGTLQIREIAERRHIPQHYLEQILVTLKQAGFIRSFRGARGGYTLTQHPDSIRLLEVLTTLEGPLSLTPPGQTAENTAFLWEDMERHIASYLTKSLGDVLREKSKQSGDQDFII